MVGFLDYRTSMLLDLKTNQLFLMNLQLYLAWVFEIVMVLASVLTWMAPLGSFILFAIKRRPAMCRICIVVLLLKFMTAIVTHTFEFGYAPVYRCGIDGNLYENRNLVEPIVVLSGFFTHLVLNSPTTAVQALAGQDDIFDSRHLLMVLVGGFLLLSYCSKLHMQHGNEASIMTSFEVGMMFTIIIKVVMSAFGMWYVSFNGYIEPSLNEEILLTHLCVKWQINTNLPKLEKLSKILETLTDALNAKKNFDREIEELVLKEEKDINEYKQLMQSENWKNMQTLVSEVLSFDSRICYMKIKEEIAFLQE